LKSHSARPETNYSYEPYNAADLRSLSVPLYENYVPPTTWKPQYPKILEHTLRYGHRLKKHVDSQEYDYEYYE